MARYTVDPAFRYRLTWTHQRELPLVPAPQPEPLTFGHFLAVVSGGVVLGILAWLIVVGLLTVGSS